MIYSIFKVLSTSSNANLFDFLGCANTEEGSTRFEKSKSILAGGKELELVSANFVIASIVSFTPILFFVSAIQHQLSFKLKAIVSKSR